MFTTSSSVRWLLPKGLIQSQLTARDSAPKGTRPRSAWGQHTTTLRTPHTPHISALLVLIYLQNSPFRTMVEIPPVFIYCTRSPLWRAQHTILSPSSKHLPFPLVSKEIGSSDRTRTRAPAQRLPALHGAVPAEVVSRGESTYGIGSPDLQLLRCAKTAKNKTN